MKDINSNIANGYNTEVTKPEPSKEDINEHEKRVKKNSMKSTVMASNEGIVNYIYNMYTELCENVQDEVVNVEGGITSGEELSDDLIDEEEHENNVEQSPVASAPAEYVPKYKYTDDQWSSQNKSGKKCYDLELLKQIKEDPLSKKKPNAPLLETCDVIRSAPMREQSFNLIIRPVDDTLFPTFLRGLGGSKNDSPKDPKKDGGNKSLTGKPSVKPGQTSLNSNRSFKPVIHVSLSSREDVKLKQVDSAWKPTRLVRENLSEEEIKTQELFKKFRGILNKLTPQKFETLVKKVLDLEIDNQMRMEGVIDLLFEKAIEEPNFSEVYANMCLKLSKLKVPSDNNGDNVVNFRILIINKCQNQFETGKSDEKLMKLEKELAETTEHAKKKELQMMINEENRKIRLRAVANVRFIGELYKLKILTSKIMDYCMRYLIDRVEEENLECLCKLLTTIGEQLENEGGSQIDSIFKQMQDIVKRKSNKISSRVKFMIQDVIDLRRRKWLVKSVVDLQPKMMDQIQKEAEQHQRHIELMNAGASGASGAGGGRHKRGGDTRRLPFEGASPRPTRPSSTNYKVDQFKLQAGSNQKNLSNIKLAPPKWMVPKTQQAPTPTNTSFSTNMYSVLENVQADPTTLRDGIQMGALTVNTLDGDNMPACPIGASIENPDNSKGDFTNEEGTACVTQSPSDDANTSQETLPYDNLKKLKSIVGLSLINPDDEQFRQEILQFETKYHAGIISAVLNELVEKTFKDVNTLTKSLVHLVTTNTISLENFEAGLKETLYIAPDQYIDIPKFYDNIGIILAPHIEKKHITLAKTFHHSGTIIAAEHGHLLLKAIIHNLKEKMGYTLVKDMWHESGLRLSQWMDKDQVPKWIAENKFEFLEDQGTQTHQVNEEITEKLTPLETLSTSLQLMNSDEKFDTIKE